MLGAVIAAFILNSTHKATMEILVNDQRSDPTVTSQSTQGQGAPAPVGDTIIGSEIELLKSPDLLEAVVLANKLQERERKSFTHYLHPGAKDDWYIARAVQHLGSKLGTQQVTKTSMIGVKYSAGDPTLAYHVLDSLGRLYLAKHNAVRRPAGSYTFFAAEADKYQRALADSEAPSRLPKPRASRLLTRNGQICRSMWQLGPPLRNSSPLSRRTNAKSKRNDNPDEGYP